MHTSSTGRCRVFLYQAAVHVGERHDLTWHDMTGRGRRAVPPHTAQQRTEHKSVQLVGRQRGMQLRPGFFFAISGSFYSIRQSQPRFFIAVVLQGNWTNIVSIDRARRELSITTLVVYSESVSLACYWPSEVGAGSDLGAVVQLQGDAAARQAMKVSSTYRYHEDATVTVGVLLGVLKVEKWSFWWFWGLLQPVQHSFYTGFTTFIAICHCGDGPEVLFIVFD